MSDSSKGAASTMQLPYDCLFIIFQWLDCSSDREAFGLTCHRWLSVQNRSRQSLQFQCSFALLNRSSPFETNLVINACHLHRLLIRFQHLRHLSLSGCTELPDSGLSQLQFYGSKLHSLHLDCCFGITDNGLLFVARGCPSLKVISLYRCNVTDVGLETLAGGCSALTHINLSYCSLVSDNGLSALAKACYQLQAVKLSCCRGVTGSGLRECSPNLAYIDAESCMLEPEGIMGMISGGGVEFLNVSGVSWWTRGDGLAAIGAGFGTRLKILNLRMCTTVGDESIVAIAKGCPLLEEWNLALCHEVRISGWKSIGIHCKNLQQLHVNRCWNLCDRGLQALREGCERLSILYISRSGRLLTPIAVELFKLYRSNVQIRDEEVMYIGPDWKIR